MQIGKRAGTCATRNQIASFDMKRHNMPIFSLSDGVGVCYHTVYCRKMTEKGEK